MTDYTAYRELAPLPPLVKQQRKLEAQIVPLADLLEQEKAVRAQIDALLIAAGLQKGDGVACLGYDVTHCERKGQSVLNPDKIVAKLMAIGIDEGVALAILVESTEVGEPSHWATVKPQKGSKVRLPMAKASLPARRRSS